MCKQKHMHAHTHTHAHTRTHTHTYTHTHHFTNICLGSTLPYPSIESITMSHLNPNLAIKPWSWTCSSIIFMFVCVRFLLQFMFACSHRPFQLVQPDFEISHIMRWRLSSTIIRDMPEWGGACSSEHMSIKYCFLVALLQIGVICGTFGWVLFVSCCTRACFRLVCGLQSLDCPREK